MMQPTEEEKEKWFVPMLNNLSGKRILRLAADL
jgi:hypothetical protein